MQPDRMRLGVNDLVTSAGENTYWHLEFWIVSAKLCRRRNHKRGVLRVRPNLGRA